MTSSHPKGVRTGYCLRSLPIQPTPIEKLQTPPYDFMESIACGPAVRSMASPRSNELAAMPPGKEVSWQELETSQMDPFNMEPTSWHKRSEFDRMRWKATAYSHFEPASERPEPVAARVVELLARTGQPLGRPRIRRAFAD